ncbi:ATP-binding protein [Granulosicoccus sp. 3-233]|uniref:sensor histidine kinase n=1 Tax=Granulosicoccus sp. 3-233 TaxID=3417969 RepID=UPI003D346499
MAATSDNTVAGGKVRSLANAIGNSLGSSCPGRGITCPEESTTAIPVQTDSLSARLQGRLFQRFGLLRSISFRMGFLFWLLFTLCFGGGAYMVYTTLQDRVLERIDKSIEGRFADMQDVYETIGIEAVVKMADARSNLPMVSSMGFHLSNAEGERVAGNLPVCQASSGWEILTGEDLGLEGDNSQYRFYTGNIGDFELSMGKSLDDLVELRKITLSCLLWTSLLSTLLAFVVGGYFARSTHKRVGRISASLDAVGKGNLRARLPVSCAGDDVDQLSEKINGSLERLEHTVNGMRQVSTDIAHDLKTPLNRLYIGLEEAASKSRSGACVGQELDEALEETQAINATFEALLRIAQIEAGARKSQFRHFDLANVLETAAEVYSPVVDEHCQELIMDMPTGQSLPMFGDRQLLLQLVVNLIENAVHHCSDNTVIRLSAGEEGGIVWFRVADSGPGIPAAEREKVFQRLYRLERSRTTRGTGLGLSLVKAISDLHCGRIAMDDNEPGLAVTVRFDRNCPSDAQ